MKTDKQNARAEKLVLARTLARRLRQGSTISFCDHTLVVEAGKVVETFTVYDMHEGHYFASISLTFSQIRRALVSGCFH